LNPEVTAAMYRLEALVRTFEDYPDPRVQEGLVDVLRAVDVIHRSPLRRLSALLEECGVRDEALCDPHLALLFGLYEDADREVEDERSRAEAVAADIRPYVEAHGGRLDVVAAEDGVVTIRLLGGCESCCGSGNELRAYVEEALRSGLPDFVRMDVAATPPRPAPAGRPAPVLIPLSVLGPSDGKVQPSGGCGSQCGGGGSDRGCHSCS
jgi:Fe-S cluster biogenesis protein NfuA